MDKVELKNFLSDSFWIMPATPKFIDSGVSYITSKNIKNGVIEFDTAKYISEEDFLRISKKRPIIKDDILVSMIGTLGEAAIVKEEYDRFYGQNVYLLRLDDSLLNYNFFLFFLRSLTAKRHLEGQMNQSTQRYLKAEHVESLKLPSIDIKKQEQIVVELSRLDSIIDLKKKQLQEYDQLIKSRFVEMFGDPKINDKNLLVVNPTHISERIFAGGDKPKDVSNIQTEEFPYPIFSNGEKEDGLYGWSKEYRVEEKSITVSGRGTIGFSCLREGKFTPIVRLITIIPNERVNSIYLNHFLNLEREDGSGTGVKQLTVPMFKKKNIILPDRVKQDEFADFVEQVDTLKVKVQKSLDETQTLFDSLMQEYFG